MRGDGDGSRRGVSEREGWARIAAPDHQPERKTTEKGPGSAAQGFALRVASQTGSSSSRV